MIKKILVFLVVCLFSTMIPVSSAVGEGDDVVNFPDPRLEAAVRSAIDKPEGDILASEVAGLETLIAREKGISDITGLEYFVSLRTLTLHRNLITDIAPLAELTSLRTLKIHYNRISDLTPLAGLTNLNNLRVHGNHVTNIEPLANLTNLTTLYLGPNEISNITPLSGLVKLKVLKLGYCLLMDVEPLATLINLQNLRVSDNMIIDPSPLASLVKLRDLRLSANQITDPSSIETLVNLRTLTLSKNHVSDCSVVANMPNLEVIKLHTNPMSDITPLEGLLNLRTAKLHTMEITDITALVNNPGIDDGDWVMLGSNPLSEQATDIDIPILIERGVRVDLDSHLGRAEISAIDPDFSLRGMTTLITITGDDTQFNAKSKPYFGPGTAFFDIDVQSPTLMNVMVAVAWNAEPGKRNVVVKGGGHHAVGENMFTILDVLHVPKPTGLTASSGATSIFLKWDPSTLVQVAGYNVYRSMSDDGNSWTKLNHKLLTEASFEDDDVIPGATYYYAVTVVSNEGEESAKSDIASSKAGQITVTMPDIRGNAGTSVRLPVNLDAAWGIRGSGTEIHVTYNTAILTATDVEKTVLTRHYTLTDNTPEGDGQVDILLEGSGKLKGKGHIVDIIFDVSPTAQKDDTAQFAFSDIKMFDGDGNPLEVDFTDTAIFTVADGFMLGDANGDGEVTMKDARLVMKFILGKEEPTELQFLASDMNGDGELTTADVTLIIHIILGIPMNPQDGAKARAAAQAAGSYTLSVADGEGLPGDLVPISISIDQALGVAGSDLTLIYDPSLIFAENVTLGDLSAGYLLDWKSVPGILTISLGDAQALGAVSGELCVVYFRVNSTAGLGESVLDLVSATLSGEYGEDLSWYAPVGTSSGSLVVNGFGAPGGGDGDGDGDGGPGAGGAGTAKPVAGMPVAGAMGLGLVAAALALGGSMFLRKK